MIKYLSLIRDKIFVIYYKLTKEEFDKYTDLKEEYFGILIKKEDCDELIIGSCDLCGCKVDSSFKEIKENEDKFYKKLKEIAIKKIIKSN